MSATVASEHVAPVPSSGRRLQGIEGLRATAIVVTHVWGLSIVGGPVLRAHHLEMAFSALSAGVVGLAANLVFVAAVAGTLSALTYRYVERPALNRTRPMRTQVTAADDAGPTHDARDESLPARIEPRVEPAP